MGYWKNDQTTEMPRVILTEDAINNLERCRLFLEAKNANAAKKAAKAINHQFLALEASPEMGRPFDDIPLLRELIIPFGKSGYVALYRYEKNVDTVYILTIRHQNEAGY